MEPRPPCPVWSIVSYGKQLPSATSIWETIKHIQHRKLQCIFFSVWPKDDLTILPTASQPSSPDHINFSSVMFIYLVLASRTSEYFNLVIKETTLASLDLISCHKSLQAANSLQEHPWYVILHRQHCRLWCCYLFPNSSVFPAIHFINLGELLYLCVHNALRL